MPPSVSPASTASPRPSLLAAGSNQVCVFSISTTNALYTLLGPPHCRRPRSSASASLTARWRSAPSSWAARSCEYLTPLPRTPRSPPGPAVPGSRPVHHAPFGPLLACRHPASEERLPGDRHAVQLHVSDDLVTWRHVMDLPADVPGAYRAWAPEFLVDADGSSTCTTPSARSPSVSSPPRSSTSTRAAPTTIQ